MQLGGSPGARQGIYKALQRRDTVGGVNLNTTGNVATDFNSESIRATDFYDARDGGNPTRLTVSKTGVYRVTYSINLANTGAGVVSIKGWAAKNGVTGTELEGSASSCLSNAVANTRCQLEATFLVSLTAADYLEIYATRVVGTSTLATVASASHVLIEMVSYPGESNIGGQHVIVADSSLVWVLVSKGVSGSSGSTMVDVLVNGTSILATSKLTLAAATASDVFGVDWFGSVNFTSGSLLTVDMYAEETEPARDVVVTFCFRVDAR